MGGEHSTHIANSSSETILASVRKDRRYTQSRSKHFTALPKSIPKGKKKLMNFSPRGIKNGGGGEEGTVSFSYW